MYFYVYTYICIYIYIYIYVINTYGAGLQLNYHAQIARPCAMHFQKRCAQADGTQLYSAIRERYDTRFKGDIARPRYRVRDTN